VKNVVYSVVTKAGSYFSVGDGPKTRTGVPVPARTIVREIELGGDSMQGFEYRVTLSECGGNEIGLIVVPESAVDFVFRTQIEE